MRRSSSTVGSAPSPRDRRHLAGVPSHPPRHAVRVEVYHRHVARVEIVNAIGELEKAEADLLDLPKQTLEDAGGIALPDWSESS